MFVVATEFFKELPFLILWTVDSGVIVVKVVVIICAVQRLWMGSFPICILCTELCIE